jgi:hypothetical protein
MALPARQPGITNLQHSYQNLIDGIYFEFLFADQGSSALINSPKVSEYLREEFLERFSRFEDWVNNPPAWKNFSLAEKAQISLLTGTGFRWITGNTNFAQDYVPLMDSGVAAYINEQAPGEYSTFDDEGNEFFEFNSYCNDPTEQFVGMTEPCEVNFESNCYSILAPSVRGESLVPLERQFSRLFGCEDWLYTLKVLEDELGASIKRVNSALGTVSDGGVEVLEWLDAAGDQTDTALEFLADPVITKIPPWLLFGGAALVFVLVKK